MPRAICCAQNEKENPSAEIFQVREMRLPQIAFRMHFSKVHKNIERRFSVLHS